MSDSVASSKMKCPYCGKEINQDSIACQYCGRAVLKTSSSNQKESGQREQQALHQVTANTTQAKPEAKNETPASKPLPVIGKCKKCGLEKKGRRYEFFYGLMIRNTSSQVTGTVVRTTSTFTGVRSATMFLCDSCVLKSTVRLRLFSLGSALIIGGGLIAYSINNFFLVGKLGDGFLCLLPTIFFISTFAYFGLRKKNNDDGESLAVELARAYKIQGSDNRISYWTTEKNREMKKL